MNEYKKIISRPLLICMTVVLGVCTVLPASGGGTAKGKHVAESSKNYKQQDASARKSREAAQKGDYREAIRILREEVVSILELEAAEVDSWVARKRLAEYSTELRNLQLTFGNMKLEAAEKALVNGQFEDAIAYANELLDKETFDEKDIKVLKSKALNLVKTAVARRNAKSRAAKVSVDTTDPKLKDREKVLRQKLEIARMYFRKGMYDDAMSKIEEIYAINPFNADAAYLATQIYKRFYQIGVQRRRADLQAQFAYEAWQWVEPNFPRAAPPPAPQSEVKTSNDSSIQERLDSTILPKVIFNASPMEEVIDWINKNQPTKDNPVNITLIQTNEKKKVSKKDEQQSADPDAMPGDGENNNDDEDDFGDNTEGTKQVRDEILVRLNLKNVPLRQLLDYICYLTDYTYVIRDDGVIFGAPDQRMISKDYDIYDTVKFLVVGRKKPTPAANAPANAPADDAGEGDGEGDGEGGGGDDMGDGGGDDMGGDIDDVGGEMVGDGAGAVTVDDSELTPDALKKFFSMYGVEFPKGSSISYFRGKISMLNTNANHLMFASLLEDINVPGHMVEVEVKSIELSENDMEELGFNWALSGIAKGDNDSSKQWMFAKGENTNSGGALSMLNGLLSGVDSRLISNLNIFPDVFGSFKPFGSDVSFNLTLTINALDRSDRTEQISAPRVLVANGFPAVVKMTKAYFFPEEWEELEVETEEIGDEGDVRLTITYPSPTFAETESEIGTTFTVTPTILEDGNTIRLKLNPKVTAYTGKDEYEVVLVVEELVGENWERDEMRFVVWRPVIATREIAVTVDVNHGETMVIGGLSDSQSQKRLDKIPILADIPFIGRLFQNQSEISVRRNMLIFVTARLIDNSGMPSKETNVGNGGIPLLMR